METVILDGGSFIGADLSGKTLAYAGGPLPDLLGAHLDKSGWAFTGGAANTLALLAILDFLESGFATRAIEEFKKQIPLRYRSRQ